MRKVLKGKPGPKFSKQSRVLSKRGTLGETSNSDESTSDEDLEQSSSIQPSTSTSITRSRIQQQEEPESVVSISPAKGQQLSRSIRKTRKSGRLNPPSVSKYAKDVVNMQSDSDFRTPDAPENLTDYGLEFTTSHIQNPSPQRCSTFRTNSSEEEDAGSTPAGSRQPLSLIQESTTPTSAVQKQPTTIAKLKEKIAKRATARTTKQPEKENRKQQQEQLIEEQQPSTSNQQEVRRKQTENHTSLATNQQNQVKKKHRKQLNPLSKETRFINEVVKLQNRTDFLIPRLPFARAVRDALYQCNSDVSRFTETALEALQTASELYLTQRLQDAYMLTLHRNRVTLDVKDMRIIEILKSNL